MSEEVEIVKVAVAASDAVEVITGDSVEVDGWEVIEDVTDESVADVIEVEPPTTDICKKDPVPEVATAAPITPLTDFGASTIVHYQDEPVMLGDHFFMAELTFRDIISSDKTSPTGLRPEFFESLYDRMRSGLVGELRHNIDLDLQGLKIWEYSARASMVKTDGATVLYDDPKVVEMYSSDGKKTTYLLARATKIDAAGRTPVSPRLAHPILFAARAFMAHTQGHGCGIIEKFVTFDLNEIHAKKALAIGLTEEEREIATRLYPSFLDRVHVEIPVANFLPK